MQPFIRRARPADATVLAEHLAAPEVQPHLLQLPYAHEELWRQRLSAAPAPYSAELLLVAELGGAIVGNAGLHPAGNHVRRRHAMVLGISVIGAAQGKGVGTALLGALLDYADDWAHCLRVELTVFADNERAIHLYRRHGFEVEGRHRGYALRGGVYADVLAMARWHPHPPSSPAPAKPEIP